MDNDNEDAHSDIVAQLGASFHIQSPIANLSSEPPMFRRTPDVPPLYATTMRTHTVLWWSNLEPFPDSSIPVHLKNDIY
jgi:hypothetical protein